MSAQTVAPSAALITKDYSVSVTLPQSTTVSPPSSAEPTNSAKKTTAASVAKVVHLVFFQLTVEYLENLSKQKAGLKKREEEFKGLAAQKQREAASLVSPIETLDKHISNLVNQRSALKQTCEGNKRDLEAMDVTPQKFNSEDINSILDQITSKKNTIRDLENQIAQLNQQIFESDQNRNALYNKGYKAEEEAREAQHKAEEIDSEATNLNAKCHKLMTENISISRNNQYKYLTHYKSALPEDENRLRQNIIREEYAIKDYKTVQKFSYRTCDPDHEYRLASADSDSKNGLT